LCRQRRTLTDQEVAPRHHRVADVVSEDVLAHVLEEEPSHRVALEHLAALVTRTSPRSVPVVLQQLAEERGEQPLHVLLDASQECLLVEVSGLETGYQYPSHLVKVGRVKHIRVAFGDEKYGHLEPSLMARSKDEAGVVPADHDGTKVRPVVDGFARLVGTDG